MIDQTLAHWHPDTSGSPLFEETLGDMLDRQTAKYGSRPAAILFDDARGIEMRWSYAQLHSAATETARGLIGLGVLPGDHVAVMATNGPEWLRLEVALAKIGATLVTVNPGLLKDELAYVLEQGRVAWLIAIPSFRRNDIAGNLAALMPDLAGVTDGRRQAPAAFPTLKGIVGIGSELPAFAMPFDHLTKLAEGVSTDEVAARQAAVEPQDIMQIQYTSGTTGKPKGAMLTHRGIVNNGRLMAERAGYRTDDVLLSAMPFFHTAGCVCNVIGMLSVGGCLASIEGFDAERMVELWDELGATIINAVPTMFLRMLDSPEAEGRTLQLRIASTGGTSIPPTLMERLYRDHGARPMIIMGMTECSPIITQTDPNDPMELKITTAGTPLPHTEIQVIDPVTGITVACGQEGELCIRGYQVTAGYFDMPEKTSETIDGEGWLHSGDLAVLDETGHLRIVGRLKDMLIRGGENVYPVEIENYLNKHPDIQQAEVVGVSDPEMGEEVFAFLRLAEGRSLTEKEVQDYCRKGLARHKMPKFVAFMEEFPMTANGKIQKFELRRLAEARVEEQSHA